MNLKEHIAGQSSVFNPRGTYVLNYCFGDSFLGTLVQLLETLRIPLLGTCLQFVTGSYTLGMCKTEYE